MIQTWRPWILALVVLLGVFGCSPKEDASETLANEPELLDAVRTYLEGNLMSPQHGGDLFCAFEVMKVEEAGDTSTLYLWTVCIEFTLEDGKLLKRSAISVPVALTAVEGDQGYTFPSCQQPIDGIEYGETVRKIFPEDCHPKIFPETRKEIERYDARAVGLMEHAERRARAHFGLE